MFHLPVLSPVPPLFYRRREHRFVKQEHNTVRFASIRVAIAFVPHRPPHLCSRRGKQGFVPATPVLLGPKLRARGSASIIQVTDFVTFFWTCGLHGTARTPAQCNVKVAECKKYQLPSQKNPSIYPLEGRSWCPLPYFLRSCKTLVQMLPVESPPGPQFDRT